MTNDEIPLFPVDAPAELGDAATVRPLLAPVLADLAAVVDSVTDDDLSRPTPCRDFDLATLRDHVVGWADFFGAAFTDPARRGTRPDPEAFEGKGRDDLADVVRAAAQRLDASLAGGVLDGEVVVSSARMSGPGAIGMVLGEYVVHGWDLATALGRPWTPPEQAVTLSHTFFSGMIQPEYRAGDTAFFSEEVPVPDDASPLDKLLGFAGRDPRWTPQG